MKTGDIIELRPGESFSQLINRVQDEEPEPIQRFEKWTYRNNSTLYTIVIAFLQGHDELESDIPEGFVESTGVIVAAMDLGPQSHHTGPVDPTVNCRASRVECNFRWRYNSTGHEEVRNHPDKVAQPDQFFRTVTFGIRDPQQRSETPEFYFESEEYPASPK